MQLKVTLALLVFSILNETASLEERCLEKPKSHSDGHSFRQSIPGLRDMDLSYQDPPDRRLTLVAIDDLPSNQLMTWAVYYLLTEGLFFEGVDVVVAGGERRNMFRNFPSNELSVSTELWYSKVSINNMLQHHFKTTEPTNLSGRFNLYIPSWLLADLKVESTLMSYNCSIPLHHHPLKSIFHSQLLLSLHQELKSIFDLLLIQPTNQPSNQSTNQQFTSLIQPSAGLRRLGRYAVYRSEGCVGSVDGCLIIAASNYEFYGQCLVQMVERTSSKVVIFWIGSQALHQFVMGKSSERVLYFGWNLDTLHSSGLFVAVTMMQRGCFHGDCTWGYYSICKAVTKDLEYSAPIIEKFIMEAHFTNHHISTMLHHKLFNFSQTALKHVACDWLRNNKGEWLHWLNGIPTKYPVTIIIFYPLQYSVSALLAATFAIRKINANNSILPNHQLILHNYRPGMLSDGNHYNTLLDVLSSGLIKGGFGPLTSSFSRLPKLMDSFKTVFFSVSAPVDLLAFESDQPTDTYFTMVSELHATFAGLRSLFEEFTWSRASFIVQKKSKMYKTLAKYLKVVFKERMITVVEEVKVDKDVQHDGFFKALDGIKDARSNIIILLISQELLVEVLCILHHKGMTPQNGFVYIYVSGLNEEFVRKHFLSNTGNKTSNRTGTPFNKTFECKDRSVLIDSVISIQMANTAENLDDIIFNKTIRQWYHQFELIHSKGRLQDYSQKYHIFDSIVAYSFALDHYLRNNPNDLHTLATERQMGIFKRSMKTVSFDGLSGHVEFTNMDRKGHTLINQYHVNKKKEPSSVMMGIYQPSDNHNEESLRLNKQLFRWGTRDGSVPLDIKAKEKEPCNLQVISDLFHVSCNQAIIIFSFLIAFLIIIPVFLFIYLLKRRFDNQNITENVISQTLRENWEMKREDIVLNRMLGHGEFGTVFGGEVLLGGGALGLVPVAIKILKFGARNVDKVAFFVEADLMKDFKHDNIMRLIGVCSIVEPYMVVMEFMMYGDLRSYLLSRRHLVKKRDTIELDSEWLTKMALDISMGLEYLFNIFCIHRDLACRNCLVHETGLIKIGDFGLTQRVFGLEGYTSSVNDSKFPIRWMAPECLRTGLFSFASDVWAFAILLYEIFTFGAIPYYDLTNQQVMKHIKQGRTIQLPSSCPEDLANMLRRCWAYEADDRPKIQDLREELNNNTQLLEPCLDLPRPQLDPKEVNKGVNKRGNKGSNLKGLLDPLQWVTRLSTSSTTGLLARNRNFARAGSMQSPEKSPDMRGRMSEERYFSYPSNIASNIASGAPEVAEIRPETKSEAHLEGQPQKKMLLKGLVGGKAFARSVSSEQKGSRFKAFWRTPKKQSPDLSIDPLVSKSHQQ